MKANSPAAARYTRIRLPARQKQFDLWDLNAAEGKSQYVGVHCDQHGPDRAERVCHLDLDNLEGCSIEERWALLESSQILWVGPTKEGNSSSMVDIGE